MNRLYGWNSKQATAGTTTAIILPRTTAITGPISIIPTQPTYTAIFTILAAATTLTTTAAIEATTTPTITGTQLQMA